jgi:hypothetical protein
VAHPLDWFSSHPESQDLLQGPLLYDDLQVGPTHLEPMWRAGMYGKRGHDARVDEGSHQSRSGKYLLGQAG